VSREVAKLMPRNEKLSCGSLRHDEGLLLENLGGVGEVNGIIARDTRDIHFLGTFFR
jgi:hypothetical protein